MTTLVAQEHPGWSPELLNATKHYTNYVETIWDYNNMFWSCFATKQTFMEWVDAGFPVTCYTCWWDKRGLESPEQCSHVVYAGDRKKIQNIVKAMRMGLV